MFALGLLAVVQMTLLPGFLLVYGFRLCSGSVRIITCSFFLSALLNDFLVQFCLLFGVYTAGTLYAVLAMETLLLCYLLYRRGVLRLVLAGEARPDASRESLPILPNTAPTDRSLAGLWAHPQALLGMIALGLIVISFFEVYARLGDTFNFIDSVKNWNRWATEMAGNNWPTRTWSYPQLVPANFSISYVITGQDTIWFFSKSWLALFFPVLMLSMYQFYREEGRWELALAVVFTFCMFYRLLGTSQMYNAGIVDIALPAFAFGAVACVHRAAVSRGHADRKRELVLAALFAAGCALTKQGGLFLLFIYPLLAIAIVGRGCDTESRRQLHRFLWLVVALMLLAVLPWYVSPFLDDATYDALSLQTGTIHADRGFGERLLHSAESIADKTSWPGLLVVAYFLAVSLAAPSYRTIGILTGLAYFLFWAIGFSYSLRNLTLAIPLLAVAMAMGVGVVWTWCKQMTASTRFITPGHLKCGAVAFLGFLLVVSLNQQNSQKHLDALHAKAFYECYGDGALNRELRDYFRESGERNCVLTNYSPMSVLPFLKDCCRVVFAHSAGLDHYQDFMSRKPIRLLLLDRLRTRGDVLHFVDGQVKAGEYEQVLLLRSAEHRYVLYRKVLPPLSEEVQTAAGGLRESPDAGRR